MKHSAKKHRLLRIYMGSSKEFAKANSRVERVLPQAEKYLTLECASLVALFIVLDAIPI
jgi:hypothetical protein